MPQRSLTTVLLIFALSAVAPGGLFADPGPPSLRAAPPEPFRAGVFGRFGFGRLGEDSFVTISPGAVFHVDRVGIGVQVPLRFRVIDEAPHNDHVLRDEDWDEVSDFTRILRFVEYGKRGDWLYARLGEMVGATLGHGTIVDRYYNTTDVDHYQTGVEVGVDAHYGGGQLVLDNVIDPNIFGLRGFVRPLTFFDVAPIFERVELGFTYASDYQAPSRIRRTKGGAARTTNDGELAVDTEVVTLYGMDLGWKVVEHEVVDVTPYFDVNFLDRIGAGIHLGVLTDIRLPAETSLHLRLEYRYLTNQYAAGYFNSLYEIERYTYRRGLPKLRYLADLGRGSGRHGFYGVLTLRLFQKLTVTVTYEDYQGSDNSSLTARVRLPWLGPVQFQAYYAKRNFGGPAEIFDLDGALLLAEARVRVLPWLFVYGTYAREWHLVDPDTKPHYATVDDWNVGVGAAWEF